MITIHVRIGLDTDTTRDVQAEPIGELFGIHRTIGGSGWTLTHLPSGLAAAMRDDRSALRLIASRLITACPLVDWLNTDRAYYVGVKDICSKAIRDCGAVV